MKIAVYKNKKIDPDVEPLSVYESNRVPKPGEKIQIEEEPFEFEALEIVHADFFDDIDVAIRVERDVPMAGVN